MSELCSNIVQNEDLPLSGKEIVMKCRSAVLETCGIDISAVLQEQVRLGQTVKQILDEIRSLNGSLCLKYNFGVAPWRLGVPHRVNIKVQSESKQQCAVFVNKTTKFIYFSLLTCLLTKLWLVVVVVLFHY